MTFEEFRNVFVECGYKPTPIKKGGEKQSFQVRHNNNVIVCVLDEFNNNITVSFGIGDMEFNLTNARIEPWAQHFFEIKCFGDTIGYIYRIEMAD